MRPMIVYDRNSVTGAITSSRSIQSPMSPFIGLLNLVQESTQQSTKDAARQCIRELTSNHTTSALCELAVGLRLKSDASEQMSSLIQFIFHEDELSNIANNHQCMAPLCTSVWGRYGSPATLFEVITGLKPACTLEPGAAEASGLTREAILYHMKDYEALRNCDTELAWRLLFQHFQEETIKDIDDRLAISSKFPRTVEFYLTLIMSTRCNYNCLSHGFVDNDVQFNNLEIAVEMLLNVAYHSIDNSKFVHALLTWQFSLPFDIFESEVIMHILLATIKLPHYKVTRPKAAALLEARTMYGRGIQCSICLDVLDHEGELHGIIGCGDSLAQSKHFLCWDCESKRYETECPTCKGTHLIRGLLRS